MVKYKAILTRTGIRFGAFCIRLTLSLFTAWLVSIPLIPAAAKERGYEGAYGSEWLIIMGVFIATYYLTSKRIRPP